MVYYVHREYHLFMNLKALFPAVVVSLIVGLGVGGYFGRAIGGREAREEYQALLDLAYPPPVAEIHRISGTVRAIVGATIQLDANDPEDYLPHLDNSPRKTVSKRANITATTEYVFVDYSKPQKNGDPSRAPFALSDLKAGDKIVVESDENIRAKESFTVSLVQQVRF
ncbi:hypothetical protein A3A21_00495 [Candidatus Jorgensenbacteria bacterium RIFCSPLOWO2_01_FULL_45_25b]|uniref:Uncharacterized protein n=2 Tax=Parcubacteria group TaxID=1794811 RepID=A0A1F6BV94_9BACT|nr:MAG: hypothetical protein A3A21_00495 [Candidatus Jorgensenbacteria bacterium RIFCSPLOWO2_01_FULL_45_25b]